jgi:putative transposase
MGLARSTYYETPRAAVDDTAIVEAMATICDAFEAYGRRRVGAALRRQLDRSSPDRIARALLWTSKS